MGLGKPPNRELVVYVLGKLGGSFKSIHTEDIASKAHELFPDAFSWTKYTNLPDKDIVRVALTDARKERYGALVEGRSGQAGGHPSKTNRARTPDGWILTDSGIEWFNRKANSLAKDTDARMLSDHRQNALRRLRRVLNHPVFRDYEQKLDSFDPSLGDMASLVRCRVDAPEDVWESRFESLKRDAMASDRKGLGEFIAKCRKAYRVRR